MLVDFANLEVTDPQTTSNVQIPSRYAGGKRSRDEEDYLCQDCDVVLTVEPCIMCAMALVHSRVRRVAFWENDPEFGGFGGKIALHHCQKLNHHPRVLFWKKMGVMAPGCRLLEKSRPMLGDDMDWAVIRCDSFATLQDWDDVFSIFQVSNTSTLGTL